MPEVAIVNIQKQRTSVNYFCSYLFVNNNPRSVRHFTAIKIVIWINIMFVDSFELNNYH